MSGLGLPDGAMGIRLCKIVKEELIACELVMFEKPGAVATTLLRGRISGRVEVGGDINDHFADVYNATGDTIIETVALDSRSYCSLKNHWMRCKVDKP